MVPVDEHETTRCIDLIRHDLSTAEGRKAAKESRVHETICEECILTSIGILNDMLNIKG